MTATGSLDRLRVDNVGSLLRPPEVKEAVLRYASGEITAAQLEAVQNDAIRQVIREQEKHGLPVLVDGEFRRATFMESFAEVTGFTDFARNLWSVHASRQLDRSGSGARVVAPSAATRTRATAPLRLARNRPREEYEFAQALTDRPVKVTLLGPDRLFQTYDGDGSREVYSDHWAFLDAVVAVEREIVAGLIAAGCRYVHMDAPGFTAYVDKPSLERFRQRGLDPAEVLTRTIAAENAVVKDFPGVTFGLHVCRGNEQSHWHREGHYDAVAEQLFSSLVHQRLLLEYDTERAGSFEPLRFVPPHTTVVVGLVTTKSGQVETVDELRRRLDEVSRYVPLDQVAISPQCGFASSLEGNDLTPDQQWRKFDVLMETAALVWGTTP
jgi:5-methyltetrahydropteroyltriglutamate--homocysteine methyltransferase